MSPYFLESFDKDLLRFRTSTFSSDPTRGTLVGPGGNLLGLKSSDVIKKIIIIFYLNDDLKRDAITMTVTATATENHMFGGNLK